MQPWQQPYQQKPYASQLEQQSELLIQQLKRLSKQHIGKPPVPLKEPEQPLQQSTWSGQPA